MSVGTHINEARKRIGLTQARLAESIGVHEMTVRRWEHGARPPDAKNLQALAHALNTTVGYLLSETDDPTRPTTLDDQDGNPRNHGDRIPPENIRPAGEMITLPVYDIRVCAGRGDKPFLEDVEKIGERTIERRLVGSVSPLDDRAPFIVKVEGDSMSEAGIRDGDEVVVNPAMDVYNGDTAMVCYGENGETAIKWVYNLPGGTIELRSATPGFPIFTYTTEQQKTESGVVIIGKVMVYTGLPKRG